MNSSFTAAATSSDALLDLHTLLGNLDDQTPYEHSPIGKTSTTTDDMMNSLFYSRQSNLNAPSSSSSSSSSLLQQQYSPMMNTPCLEAFTPAAGFMTDSPMMTTPYMDPLIGSAHFTPMMTTSSGLHLDHYFTPEITSVDPSQLALEQDQQPSLVLAQHDQPDDSLFPPLSHEQQLEQQQGNDLDLFFDDLFTTDDTFPSNQVQPPINDNKRKRSNDDTLDPAELDRMIKHAKINKDGLFLCSICDRGFSRRYNLGTHIKTHYKSRAKPFACHLCTKSFDRKHDCLRHISTVHKGERLHTCQKCAISFSRRDALHRHQAQKHTK
ncbi:hypothetical protein BC941DRAFT_410202 [Chlamydoabsidia padenii]|nr:hypothetical protein BC941DRAFT_410202 [Chlamydoabsidia padenii]